MTLDALIGVLRPFWGLWVMIFFCGIVLWAYWPKNRGQIESHADIPLRNEDEER